MSVATNNRCLFAKRPRKLDRKTMIALIRKNAEDLVMALCGKGFERDYNSKCLPKRRGRQHSKRHARFRVRRSKWLSRAGTSICRISSPRTFPRSPRSPLFPSRFLDEISRRHREQSETAGTPKMRLAVSNVLTLKQPNKEGQGSTHLGGLSHWLHGTPSAR